MARQEFPAKVKRAAWERSGGRCEHEYPDGTRCGVKLYPGDMQYDHRIADAQGGEPTLENCAVLCRPHHLQKTITQDVPVIAKIRRVRDRHIGIKRRSRPFPCGRNSPFKKRIDGTVVRR